MNTKTVVLSAVVALAVGAAGLTQWNASRAKSDYRTSLQMINGTGILIATEESYARRMMGADAITVLSVRDDETGKPEPVARLRHDTSFGPYVGSAESGRHWGSALVHTTLEPLGVFGDQWRAAVGDAPLAEAETVIRFDASSKTLVHSDPQIITEDDGKTTIQWRGFRGTIETSEDGRSVQFNIAGPGLEANNGKGELALAEFKLVSDLSLSDRGMWLGAQTLTLASLNFKDPDATQTEFWLGDIAFSNTNSVDSDYLHGDFVIDVGTLSTGVQTVSDIQYDMRWQNLHVPTLVRIQEKLQEMKLLSGSVDHGEVTAAVSEDLLALLKYAPELAIRSLKFTTEEGAALANLKLTLDNGASVDPSNVLALLSSLRGSAEVRVSPGLIKQVMLAQQVKELGLSSKDLAINPSLEDQLRREIEPMLEEQLSALEGQGLVRRDGDDYMTAVTLDDNGLKVNGNSVNPMGLLSQ